RPSDENVKLHEYLWNWWAYLVQKPEEKPRTIIVLKSTLQQCGKNIITDFIGDKVLGRHLHYATSDLEKILGRFNSAIQARKLIVMNETGMSSGDWHRFNGHLKSLITEGMVTIERKGLESKRLDDFAGYMVTSNQDAPIKIDIGDSRVVCYDVSSRCRSNTAYFKRLRNVLNHPDALGVVMKYLLSRDISDFEPQEIPATKMKEEIMRDQLPNPVRFLINYIASWGEGEIVKPKRTSLYQTYLEWCGENGEKPFSDKKLAQAFGLNEQNAEMYSTLSGENRSLKKQLEDYHSQHNSLERRVKRLERDVGSLKIKLQDLDEYVDRETVVDLIHEIVPTLINKK
ncbi:4127_t:CDS:2, partial [Funneliformis geosporum]